MSDQLSSVGVELDLSALQSLFLLNIRYYSSSAASQKPKTPLLPWADQDIFLPTAPAHPLSQHPPQDNDPDDSNATTPTTNDEDASTLGSEAAGELTHPHPWGLGQLRAPTSTLQEALGASLRRPGFFKRVDKDSNEILTREPLVNTGEAVHSCERVRLAYGGLGMDDEAVWACPSLLDDNLKKEDEGHWELQHRGGGAARDDGDAAADDLQPPASLFDKEEDEQLITDEPSLLYPVQPGDGEYQWVYTGKVDISQDNARETIPQTVCLPEEPLIGPAERLLLALTTGERDVWRYAEDKGQRECK